MPGILAVRLAPPTLRPVAFRTFTKKHNLTLQASALAALAAFIGTHCGTGWREEGTGEKVLEEVARLWKAENGGVIVEDGKRLKGILATLGSCMSGGRIGTARSGSRLSRESSFAFGNDSAVDLSNGEAGRPGLDSRHNSFGLSALHVDEAHDDDDELSSANSDPRAHLTVLSAYDQPRLTYSVEKKHFLPLPHPPSPFPPPSRKTDIFRERYNVIHQRLLRNEAFQTPAFSHTATDGSATPQQFYKLTPISNLLGRGGTPHLLLGMLAIAPTGTLALNDPSGSISLDLSHASPLGGSGEGEGPFFGPGMIVLVDGVYEEDFAGAGSSGLGNTGGVGGTIGGRFLGFGIGSPPVEKRNVSLGIADGSAEGGGEVGGGFGWTDFTGLGSERAVGARMRRLESRLLGSGDGDSQTSATVSPTRRKMVILSELLLDQPATLPALRHVLSHYATLAASNPATEAPMAFLLLGSFTSSPALAGTQPDSIAYKSLFDSLAATLSAYPTLLKHSTWVFVPGDNDPWASGFAAGAAAVWPREGVPDLFTSRVARVFTEAGLTREEVRERVRWTSNPARICWGGGVHEVLVCRDDVSGRLRRNAVKVGQAARQREGAEDERSHEEDVQMSGALPTTEDIEIDDPPASSPPAPGNATPPPPAHAKDDPTAHAATQARRTILSLLPQSHLSPFPLNLRPLHWDYATSTALSLYPLPHTLVLADPEMAAFAMTYEGCHVVNPGRLVEGGSGGGGARRKRVGWVEYDFGSRRGEVKEGWVG